MRKHITISLIIGALFGFSSPFLCYFIGMCFYGFPMFATIVVSLPSIVAMALSCSFASDFLAGSVFLIVSTLQWLFFSFAVSYDIGYRQGKSRMSLIAGGLYIVLCLACLPLLLSNLNDSARSQIFTVLGFHLLLGFAVAVMPLILTFRQQSMKSRLVLFLTAVFVSSGVALTVHTLNKPAPQWYDVTVREINNEELYDFNYDYTNGSYLLVPGRPASGRTNWPIPDKITFTWKTALPGGKEYIETQSAERNKKLFPENIDDITVDSLELMGAPFDYPANLFKSHEVVVVLKDRVPKDLEGRIFFTLKDTDEADVLYIEDGEPDIKLPQPMKIVYSNETYQLIIVNQTNNIICDFRTLNWMGCMTYSSPIYPGKMAITHSAILATSSKIAVKWKSVLTISKNQQDKISNTHFDEHYAEIYIDNDQIQRFGKDGKVFIYIRENNQIEIKYSQ